jgi:hypothetical protein
VQERHQLLGVVQLYVEVCKQQGTPSSGNQVHPGRQCTTPCLA